MFALENRYIWAYFLKKELNIMLQITNAKIYMSYITSSDYNFMGRTKQKFICSSTNKIIDSIDILSLLSQLRIEHQ